MGEIPAVLLVVGRDDLVEELGDGDVVTGEILGNGDTVLAFEELGGGDIVGREELGDDIVEELGDRDVILLQELGK